MECKPIEVSFDNFCFLLMMFFKTSLIIQVYELDTITGRQNSRRVAASQKSSTFYLLFQGHQYFFSWFEKKLFKSPLFIQDNLYALCAILGLVPINHTPGQQLNQVEIRSLNAPQQQ